MNSSPLVKAENLSRAFDVSKPWLDRLIQGSPRRQLVAVADVSFTIDRHETLGLVGESGSGKSTLAKLIIGLLPPTTGDVFFDGICVSGGEKARSFRLKNRIQMVFQDPYASLNPRLRAGAIIAEPIRTFRLSRTRASVRERVNELLRLVGLDPADALRYPHQFSSGQRQRIAIARALASQADFIVWDEPTSALDVSVQAQILNLIRDLQDQLGLTYLFVGHNLAVVRYVASRVAVMYLGRLVELAPSAELFFRPRHPYTRMLLDAVPDLEMGGRQRRPGEGEIPNPTSPPPGCTFHPRCPIATSRCRQERPDLKWAGPTMVACHAVEEGRA